MHIRSERERENKRKRQREGEGGREQERERKKERQKYEKSIGSRRYCCNYLGRWTSDSIHTFSVEKTRPGEMKTLYSRGACVLEPGQEKVLIYREMQ